MSALGGPWKRVSRAGLLYCWLALAWAAGVHAQSGLTRSPAAPFYDVVALRVEFQPDTTRFTTGDGTFDGNLFGDAGPPTVDPLPHNADYFEAHLRFLETYVERVSDGRTRVQTHLLPEVLRLDRRMGDYSPTGFDSNSDEERVKLAQLPVDAWTLAAESGVSLPAGLNPETTAFVLFHAGVGRDIELVGTSLDKTPQDLPSIYFDAAALAKFGLSLPELDGFLVTNSLIMPRTESRTGYDFLADEPFLVELSINGLLAASFFNFLGVPDLFNTETGASAIGPFGVMDGLGIFALNGLFPPEPSAFTKHFLGWSDVIPASESRVAVRHSGDPNRNDVLRVPISDAEYHLVENRHRDPEGDGVRMTVWSHEGVTEVVFPNGDNTFNDVTVSGFPGGVVLDVDNYDFALPGGVDENNNPLIGGMLIWHIDENRLAATISTNAVNADPESRAVDLEEADGAQDIGFSSGGGLFGPDFGLGSPFDFFFEGNPVTVRTSSGQDVRLYENRFGTDTFPNARSNGNGAAVWQLDDFSAAAPEMQVTLSRVIGTEAVPRPDASRAFDVPAGARVAGAFRLDGPGQESPWVLHVVDGAGAGTVLVESDGANTSANTSADPVAAGLAAPVLGPDRIGVWTGAGIQEYNADGLMASFPGVPMSVTLPVIRIGLDYVVAGTVAGQSGTTILRTGPGGLSTSDAEGRVHAMAVVPGASPRLVTVLDGAVRVDGSEYWILSPSLSPGADVSFLVTEDSDGLSAVLADRSNGSVRYLDAAGHVLDLSTECAVEDVSLMDWNGDGSPDIVTVCSRSVTVFNISGAVMDGFPVHLPAEYEGGLVVFRDGDQAGFLLRTADGSIRGWVAGPAPLPMSGFPLSSGFPADASPFLDGSTLNVVSGQGAIVAWDVPALDGRTLTGTHGNSTGAIVRTGNTSFIDVAAGVGPVPGAAGPRLIDPDQTYNWPNPVRADGTHLRVGVTETSQVTFSIADLSGRMVQVFTIDNVTAGIPSEIKWTPQEGSGIYLVRVEAVSATGQSETHLFKLAIIR